MRLGTETNSLVSESAARVREAAPQLLTALERLAFAAECRDNTAGDPARLIAVKAELADAARFANEVIAKATGVTP